MINLKIDRFFDLSETNGSVISESGDNVPFPGGVRDLYIHRTEGKAVIGLCIGPESYWGDMEVAIDDDSAYQRISAGSVLVFERSPQKWIRIRPRFSTFLYTSRSKAAIALTRALSVLHLWLLERECELLRPAPRLASIFLVTYNTAASSTAMDSTLREIVKLPAHGRRGFRATAHALSFGGTTTAIALSVAIGVDLSSETAIGNQTTSYSNEGQAIASQDITANGQQFEHLGSVPGGWILRGQSNGSGNSDLQLLIELLGGEP